MDATLSPPSARRRRSWAVRPWTLVVLALLLVAGTLIQACSDNNGTTGPKFECREQKGGVKVLTQCTGSPARVVGDAIGGPTGTINVQVAVQPGTVDRGRRAGVTFFLTNLNGFPLPGRTIAFSSNAGKFDTLSGVTGADGTFSTTMLVTCEAVTGSGSIAVVVEGKSVVLTDAFTVVTASSNDPCPAGTGVPPATGGGGGATLPSVSISASDPSATESSGDTGTFTVTRNPAGTSQLAVFYTVTGTATPVATACPGGPTTSQDYVQLSGTVIIPANQATATITVTPCNDGGVEGAETVIVTISSDPSYTGGGNAQVTIND
jgi:hypothetical protein